MGDKRFPASRKKLQNARLNGQVPQSRILTSVCRLVIDLIVLEAFLGECGRLPEWVTKALRGPVDLIEQNGGDFHTNNMLLSALEAVWVFGYGAGAPLICIALILLIQRQFIRALSGARAWSWQRLAPSATRLNPFVGFRRIFGSVGSGSGGQAPGEYNEVGKLPTRLFSELGRSVLIHCLAVLVFVWTLAADFHEWADGFGELETFWSSLRHTLWSLTRNLLCAWSLLGVLDFLVERLLVARRLRMDLAELKRELRQSEGSPETRALRRQLHQTLAQQALVQGVRRAKMLVVSGDARR